MNKELSSKILEAIQKIVESATGTVTYSVTQRDEKPLFQKGKVTRTITIDVQVSCEL